MATLGDEAMIVMISSAYKRDGLLYQRWKRFYGTDDPNVSVVRATAPQLNPLISQATIDAALADDPEAAKAEWLSEWRDDLASYITRQEIEACVDARAGRRPCRTFRRLAGSLSRLDLRQRGQPEEIAGGELDREGAGDHRVAIGLELDEAAIHLAARDDEAALAFTAMPIPPGDVRLLVQEAACGRVQVMCPAFAQNIKVYVMMTESSASRLQRDIRRMIRLSKPVREHQRSSKSDQKPLAP